MEVFYEVRGAGPPVVFHTGAGGDHRIWELAGYLDALPGFRKILIDQRGRGRSGRPETVEGHRMERFVEDLTAVLDDAGIESAGFWGYSNGIFVGLAFGNEHPKRLQALVGIGTLPFRDIRDLGPIGDVPGFMVEQVARGGVAQDVDAFMQADGERFPEAIDRNVREGDPRMYALDRIARRFWRGPKSLYATFAAPVLLIAGERETDDGETEKSLAAMPRTQGVRLPGIGHLASFYRSDLTLPQAIPFLQKHVG